MKKYLAIFLLPLLAACNKEPQESVFVGKILNNKDSVVTVTIKGISEDIKLNDDNSFLYKTIIDKPMYLILNVGNKKSFGVYINPGDSSKISIDYDNLDNSAKFSGKLEKVNGYLLNKDAIVEKYSMNFNQFYGLEKTLFNQKIDSIKNELLESAKSIDIRKISKLEEVNIGYMIQTFKANYPEYNAYANKTDFNADSVDYSVLDGLDLNNAYHLIFSDYSELVNKVIMHKFIKENGSKALESMPASERISKIFSLIDANIINKEVRDYLKQNALMEDLNYGQFWTLTDLVNKFIAECQTNGYKSIVEKLYNKKMIIAPGKPAPLFKLKDINGKEHALEDFKGTLVYIDFWATWCSPCRHELPYLDSLEKSYAGKKITFISMSVDQNIDVWKKMVLDKKMMGIQMHADGGTTIAKDYQIKGIPTFVLIDQNGTIISPSAPRPSSGNELKKLLDENLAKIK